MKKPKLSSIIKKGIPTFLVPAGIATAIVTGEGATGIEAIATIEVSKELWKTGINLISGYIGEKAKEHEIDKFFSEELSKELEKRYGDKSHYLIEIFVNSSDELIKDGKFVDEENFCKIFREEIKKTYKEDIPLEKCIEKDIYKLVTDKFKILAKDLAKKDPKAFRREVIDELENISIKIDEIYEILTKVRIPTIEDKLNKYESKNAELFKSAGPEWIDFERDCVVKRDEVDEIIEKFKNQNMVIMKGNPASGKTVISRSVGYKLANEGKDVYVLELPWDQRGIEEILKLDDLAQKSEVYFLVDNAHLNLTFLHNIVSGLKSVKILISMRDIDVNRQIGLTSGNLVADYFKEENRKKYILSVESINVSDGIIEKFEEINEIEIIDEIKRKLNNKSLWILAWELDTYKKHEDTCKEHKKIDETDFYDTVAKHIEDIGSEVPLELKVNKPENVLLPLSVFYKFEIPVRKKFIEQFADENDIENMIRLNEIREYKTEKRVKYLTLHHSETADVFVKTFQKFGEFGDEVKRKIEKKTGKDWFEGLFHWYIQESPKESVWVIDRIGGSKFIRNLLEENFDKIKEGIEAEEDVEKISLCILSIADESEKLAEKLIKVLNINGGKTVAIFFASTSEREKIDEVVKKICSWPLLGVKYDGPTCVSVQIIIGGDNLLLEHAEDVMNPISNKVWRLLSGDTDVLWRARIDSKLGDKIRIIAVITRSHIFRSN
ncbi:MAG: hypothetical protein A7316_03110 [Candidatus Altiarchaeales archaeon WOR_SM1_86-2]|nr:MAG: hypothetical protein A7316_03110 [Candidatus Altiarchaeales archaeon WOR_SM1_86-2]ODS41530.1 MAG: hypothetical protein A7315_05830 [Candidatus Altiarchaeales archaeon WOR_SM1_79]